MTLSRRNLNVITSNLLAGELEKKKKKEQEIFFKSSSSKNISLTQG